MSGKSNIKLISNVMNIDNNSLLEDRFILNVEGQSKIERVKSLVNKNEKIDISSVQQAQVYLVTNLLIDCEYKKTWGLISDSDNIKVICKCTEAKCKHYKYCSNINYTVNDFISEYESINNKNQKGINSLNNDDYLYEKQSVVNINSFNYSENESCNDDAIEIYKEVMLIKEKIIILEKKLEEIIKK